MTLDTAASQKDTAASQKAPRVTAADAVQRAAELGAVFAERAPAYDREAAFPTEDFDDLFAAGLTAATVPVGYGGLGLGPLHRAAYPLWMIARELAKADLSLARCWEGHVNAMTLVAALGTAEQRNRWFDGVVRHGEKWVVWSGEPQARKPGENMRFGTTVERTADGWLVDGRKAFASSATEADWAILMVNQAGPGGSRHLSGADDDLLMLACDLSHPSVTVDSSWWDPVGMRATVSHVVRFDRTPIPDAWLIGQPGDYLRYGWQTAFIPQYAAAFLGAAEAAYEYSLKYVRTQGKSADPYVQHRIGSIAVSIDTAHLWLAHVARLWDEERSSVIPVGGEAAPQPDQQVVREESRTAGSRARYLIEHLALSTVDHSIRVCGARSLVRPSPIERILRDLTFYVRHDNADQILATIGRGVLGLPHDAAYFKP